MGVIYTSSAGLSSGRTSKPNSANQEKISASALEGVAQVDQRTGYLILAPFHLIVLNPIEIGLHDCQPGAGIPTQPLCNQFVNLLVIHDRAWSCQPIDDANRFHCGPPCEFLILPCFTRSGFLMRCFLAGNAAAEPFYYPPKITW